MKLRVGDEKWSSKSFHSSNEFSAIWTAADSQSATHTHTHIRTHAHAHAHTYLGRFRPGEAARGSQFYGAAQHKQFTGRKSPSQPRLSDRKTLLPSRRGTLSIWAEIIEAEKKRAPVWPVRTQPELRSLLLLLVFCLLTTPVVFAKPRSWKDEDECLGKHQANALSGLVNYVFSCCYVILIS